MVSLSKTETWKGAQTFQVCPDRIGRTARDVLMATGCAGQVLAVVSHAVYLQTHGNEILWLARDGLPAHTRGLTCTFDQNALRVGMSFASGDGVLQIGDQLTLNLCGAPLWSPCLVTPARAAPPEVVKARVRRLAASWPGYADHEAQPAAYELGARGITHACRAHDMARIVLECQGLIGLGVGLTPAGDDFVGGLLFAARHLQIAYPQRLRRDRRAVDGLLSWARTQTNVISYAILSDLARGQGPAPLHDLVFALLTRAEGNGAMTHVSRLLQIGSSSGQEMLAGALTGMLLLADSET